MDHYATWFGVGVKDGTQRADKKWRVPIPRGKEREADFVIQQLYERGRLFPNLKAPLQPSSSVSTRKITTANTIS